MRGETKKQNKVLIVTLITTGIVIIIINVLVNLYS